MSASQCFSIKLTYTSCFSSFYYILVGSSQGSVSVYSLTGSTVSLLTNGGTLYGVSAYSGYGSSLGFSGTNVCVGSPGLSK